MKDLAKTTKGKGKQNFIAHARAQKKSNVPKCAALIFFERVILDLDFHLHAAGEFELHQCVDSLSG